MLNIIISDFNFNLLFIYFSTSHVAFHTIICYIVLLGYRQCQPHAFNKLTYLLNLLYLQQYSANLDVYYAIVDPIVRSTKKL